MEKIVVSCLESRIDENQSVYSRFLLGPFLNGHAVTVATALRRALLSEVKNIAITALHIQGVTHEFSTVMGIRESVLELSLNFQQVILSTQTKSRSVQIGYLHVQGPAIVHANDLKLPDGIECVNPTQYIATLSTEGLLVVKFLIGEKKSFLKSNTNTLNYKKIKEAKAYSAHLNKSLLSHAEYDPPRLFKLLRNQSLPNGSIVQKTLKAGTTFRLGAERLQTNFLPERTAPSAGSGTESGQNEPRRRPVPVTQSSPSANQTSSSPQRGQPERTAPAAGSGVRQKGNSKQTQTTEGSSSWAEGQPEVLLAPSGQHGRTAPRPSTGAQRLDREPDSEMARLPDSNIDQLSRRISDEFNSEVCLRTIIPLDPIFTPVYQVNFGIERDDLSNKIRERVIMEVWTNGSIHPRQAINEAALSTMSIFSKLRKTFQLDSHSLMLSANLTAPSAYFARGSRLHKTKSVRKGGVLNDDASESIGSSRYALAQPNVSLARSAGGSLVLDLGDPFRGNRNRPDPVGPVRTPTGYPSARECFAERSKSRRSVPVARSRALRPPTLRSKATSVAWMSGQFSRQPAVGAAHWQPAIRERFAKATQAAPAAGVVPKAQQHFGLPCGQTQGKSVTFRRFALSRRNVTKLDFAKPVRQKINTFSSLEFVRSKHPVSFFLQNFGKSHIRGQTFLLEQSFGLKARFFKGHHTVISKAKYTAENDRAGGRSEPPFEGLTGTTFRPSAATGISFRHTFKRTFLPSFKIDLGPFGASRNVPPALASLCEALASRRVPRRGSYRPDPSGVRPVPVTTKANFPSLTRPKPEQNRTGLTKAKLLLKFRFCLASAIFEPPSNRADRLLLLRSAKHSRADGGRLVGFAEGEPRPTGTGRTPSGYPELHSVRRGSFRQGSCLPWSCLVSKGLSHNRAGGRMSSPTSWPPSRTIRPSETRKVVQQPKLKPILFLMKYRSFSFTTNALRIFRSKQEDSLFLLPLIKQLIRVKMGRVLTPCLPLMSKRSEPGLRFRFTETQNITTVQGSGRFDIKRVLFSLARNAIRLQKNPLGLESNTFGSENFVERGALTQKQELPSANESAVKTNRFIQGSLAADAVSPSYGPQFTKLTKEPGKTFRLASKGPKNILSNRPEQIGHRQLVGGPEGGLKFRTPQKMIASSIALRAITPFGRSRLDRHVATQRGPRREVNRNVVPVAGPRRRPVRTPTGYPSARECFAERSKSRRYVSVSSSATSKLWLQSNLKKQFGFLQFASNSLRACSQSEQGRERLGLCVNKIEPLTNRNRVGAVRAGKRSWPTPFDFTTLPFMLTKAPPLCLSSGLVTLISSLGLGAVPEPVAVCSRVLRRAKQEQAVRSGFPVGARPRVPATATLLRQEYRRPARSIVAQEQRRWLEAESLFRLAPKGSKSKRVVRGVHRCFSAIDLFGFNSDVNMYSEYPSQLTTQAGTDRLLASASQSASAPRSARAEGGRFRLPLEEAKRVSILYSTNLDKMSLLSSDLANLSLSLKTYTFLKKKGKKNIASLLEYSPNALFSFLNGDEKMFHEVERCLIFLGLPLKERS